MSITLRFPASRIYLTGICLTLVLLFLHFRNESFIFKMTDRSGVLDNIQVSIDQSSTSPRHITVSLINKNSGPVTFLADYESPLDPQIASLGLLKITKSGDGEPLNLEKIMFRKLWPPPDSALVTIESDGQQSREIELKNPALKFEDMHGKYSLQLSGEWGAVWTKGKQDVLEEWKGTDEGYSAESAIKGRFESNVLEVDL